eukprot:TRINITY_DN2731_c0_g1_i5.p1 TRINITY_DN2731_c0_g1~~TRINITY_DN2731_c0_g1_i5.p1  ORF type:complete len:488 (+),score=122.75 TRINITY_DN2731_c0_g1_i5:184-1464(+)
MTEAEVSASLAKLNDAASTANDAVGFINTLAELGGMPGLPISSIPLGVIPTNLPNKENLIDPKAIILLFRLEMVYNPGLGKYNPVTNIPTPAGPEAPVRMAGPLWSFLYQVNSQGNTYKHLYPKYSLNAQVAGISFYDGELVYNQQLGGVEFAEGKEYLRTDELVDTALAAAQDGEEEGDEEEEEEEEAEPNDRKYLLLLPSKPGKRKVRIGVANIALGAGETEKVLAKFGLVKFLATLRLEKEEEEEEEVKKGSKEDISFSLAEVSESTIDMETTEESPHPEESEGSWTEMTSDVPLAALKGTKRTKVVPAKRPFWRGYKFKVPPPNRYPTIDEDLKERFLPKDEPWVFERMRFDEDVLFEEPNERDYELIDPSRVPLESLNELEVFMRGEKVWRLKGDRESQRRWNERYLQRLETKQKSYYMKV